MQRTVYNEEHEAFRDVAHEFVERQVLPRIDTMREQREIDRATWLEAGKQGLLGVPVPEEYGGGGVDDDEDRHIRRRWPHHNSSTRSRFPAR